MKIEICDEGRLNEWTRVEIDAKLGEDFKLFVDNKYIGAGTFTEDGNMIFVSTLHKVEFRKGGLT